MQTSSVLLDDASAASRPELANVAATVSEPARRVVFASLLIWVVGVQTQEAIATVGDVLCIVSVLAIARSEWSPGWLGRGLRSWWPLAAFLGWAVLVPLAAGRSPEGAGLGRLSDWLALPAAAAAYPLLTARQRRALAWTAAVTFTVACACALLQHYGIWPPQQAFDSLGWTRLAFDRVYEEIVGDPGRFYGGGLLFHRLKFADVGGLVVVAAFAVALSESGRTRVICGVVMALGLLSILVAAQARAASASVVAALVVMMVVARLSLKQLAAAALVMAVLLGAAFGVSQGVRTRFANMFDHDSNGERTTIWRVATRAVATAPIAGIGVGQYRASKFAPPGTPRAIIDHPGKAHNQFLSFAAEIGIPGAVLFAWLLAWLFLSVRGSGAILGRGAVAFFVILSLTHDPLFHAQVSMAFVLAFGIACGLSQPRTSGA